MRHWLGQQCCIEHNVGRHEDKVRIAEMRILRWMCGKTI